MPKIECQCEACGEGFRRVVLRGEICPGLACPECHSRQIKVAADFQGLFDGISNFSTLAKDTN